MFDRFSFITAWRDARTQWASLFLYCSGIIAGVAALVAILSFRSDVLLTVDDQARELLGADLELTQNRPFSEIESAFIDSLGGEQSVSVSFSSMVVFGTGGETRLSQIRAMDGEFPFYGAIKTVPPDAAYRYQQEGSALVDRPIMNQLGLSVGDSIRVGNNSLQISGMILEVPGQSAAFSLIGPRIFIPYETVRDTPLLDRGSRVQHQVYFRFDDGRNTEALVREARPFLREHQLRATTVESRKDDFRQIVDSLTKFLGMIGFIALLLGGLGVASAIYVYIKRKSGMVATLRCLGASSRQTISIFAIQVMSLGLAGAVAGSVLGVLIQQFLPLLFAEFLPFEIIQQLSLPALLTGLGTGLIVSLGFALLPLISINNIPPLLTLKNVDFSPLKHLSKRVRFTAGTLSVVIITLVLAVLVESLLAALVFTLALLLCVLLLLGTAKLLIRVLKLFRLPSLSYEWRQGVANLFRPNNQTAVLVTTLGMGMLLIGTLYLSQEMILSRIDFQTGGQQPDIVFYDIQSDQNEDITGIITQSGATVLENVPIVSMRLSGINGRTIREIREDTSAVHSRWALTREYRITYRDELNDAEEIIEGEWVGRADGIDSVVPISIGEQIMDELNLKMGDRIVFDVQGIPVETEVASVREIDFQRPQPNFFVLFPAGVLENAPQFFATVVRTGSPDAAAQLQQEVVASHPNVSALDIGLVLESVQAFLDKIAMAVQFMALFSIITGLIVLGSAVAISRFQRIKEAVLLRTLGASKWQVNLIQSTEYVLLGALACLTGLVLALGSGWLLAWFYFELVFVPDILALLVASAVVIALTLFVGLINMRGVNNKKPLETLRMEVS